MKKYNRFQRMANIINRAINDFGFEYDTQEPLQYIFENACELILNSITYDRVVAFEPALKAWSDGMGYTFLLKEPLDKSDDVIWMRKQDNGTFEEIDVKNADKTNDYVIYDCTFDSQGQLVCLVFK